MTRDELLALADRVEAMAGPDRETDKRIKAAIYGGAVWKSPFNGEWCLYREWSDDPKKGRVFERPHSISHDAWTNDNYTASLDAAMTLVPDRDTVVDEKLRLEVYTKPGVLPDHVRASAWVPGAARVYAATPAVALAAACLRAHAAALGE